MTDRYPKRIVCMTEETTETLYLLGEQDRIVGISGFTVRPPEARREKPKVSAFTSAKIDKILALEPDLALGFSDLQADIAAELVRRGIEVHVFNHRTVDGILNMVVQLGAMVGALDKATDWVNGIEREIAVLKLSTKDISKRPVVYFEEWNDPLITGIRWVTELIELAGGLDCFPEHSRQSLAKHRIVTDPMEVVRRRPDIIIGSWCGKKFRPEQVVQRTGWEDVPAVRHNHIYEIKSAEILQPGPAALTDGLRRVLDIIRAWHSTVS
jgi:iron complex transport system substrate-binding protein